MPPPDKLSPIVIREVGEALYGKVWQSEMAKGIGVPRQSVAYYLKSGGVGGAQAAAIIGLVGRILVRDATAQADVRKAEADRHAALTSLMVRLESL